MIVFLLSNIKNFSFTGSPNTLKTNLIKANGTWYGYGSGYTPQKGDVVFFSTTSNYDSDIDHVGIVTKNGYNSNGSVSTIEGNTSGATDSSLYVWEKERYEPKSSRYFCIVGYVSISNCANNNSSTPTPTPSVTVTSCNWIVTIPANYKLLLYNKLCRYFYW